MAGASGKPCHYAVLGVARDASAADFRAAYRRLALIWHPDKRQLQGDESGATEEEARARFLQIQEAYKVLSDASRRAIYDAAADMFLFDDPTWNAGTRNDAKSMDDFVGEMMGMMEKEPDTTMDELRAMMDDMMKGVDPSQTPERRMPRKHNSSSSSRSDPTAAARAGQFFHFTMVAPGAGTSGAGPQAATRRNARGTRSAGSSSSRPRAAVASRAQHRRQGSSACLAAETSCLYRTK